MKYALYDSGARLPTLGGCRTASITSRRFFAPPLFYYSIGHIGAETGGRVVLEILHGDSLRSLWLGGVYLLLLIVGGQVIWWVRRWLERRTSPMVLRLRFWQGWSFWGDIAGLTFTLAYLLFGLFDGAFAAGDVGLNPLEIVPEGGWLLGLCFAMVAWMALLWGEYWWRHRPAQGDGDIWEGPTWSQVLLQISSHEGRAAILRATFIPFLGLYWGTWGAVFCKWLASYLDPARRTRLREPAPRAFVYLGWAMDWLSALLYILSGSLWATLLARGMAYLPLRALFGWLYRPRRREERRLLEDQRQDDEQGEHGDGSEGKAL